MYQGQISQLLSTSTILKMFNLFSATTAPPAAAAAPTQPPPAAGAGADCKASLSSAPVVVTNPRHEPTLYEVGRAPAPPMWEGKKSRALQAKGMKPTKIVVPYSFGLNSITGGQVSGVVNVAVDFNTVEWADIAGLWDEYRVTGGDVYYIPTYKPAAPGSSGLSPDQAAFVMVYDPVDNTPLTSVRNGYEYSQKDVRVPSLVGGAAAMTSATMNMGFCAANGKPYHWRFSVQAAKALAINSTGQVAAGPGVWKSVLASGNNVDGFLKVYGFSDFAGVSSAVSGFVTLGIELRMRK